MEQWDNYFPPLNLWNYSLSWQWFNNENLSDGGDLVFDRAASKQVDSTVGDDR